MREGRARPRLHRRLPPGPPEGAGLVLEMDADFSHYPADLPRLLDAVERADVVIGSRYVAGRRRRGVGAPCGG